MGGKSSKYKKNLSKAEESYNTASNRVIDQFNNSTLSNFELFGTLGEGTFGRVRLARHKNVSDVPVAIKILKKKAAVEMKQVQHLINEKTILESVQHPSIIQLFSTFQDPSHVFMILAYISGGEMFKYLRDEGQFSVARTRAYAAEIFLALDFLHRNNIIYRDLKPENLLITKDGHMIVTDFGFAKVLKPGTRTYTTCGTPDYLAPEIIRSKGHGKPVDWWAFGVLVYEMATGFPPFYGDSVIDIYKKIIKGKMGAWPKRLAQKERPMCALVRQLLSVDITKRLGCMKKGTSQIYDHKFFKSLKWDAVYTQSSPALFTPPSSGDNFDMSNFDDYENEDVHNVICEVSEQEQIMFADFD